LTYGIGMACPAPYRYGFSGTIKLENPVDNLRIEAVTGPCRIHVTSRRLIKAGLLSVPTVYFVTDPEAFGPRLHLPPDLFQVHFDHAIIQNQHYEKAVVLVAKRLLEAGAPPLVLSASVVHLKSLLARCNQEGVPARLLYGPTMVAQRRRVMEEMQQGQDFVVLSSKIFEEGADFPELRAVVLAGGGKAAHKQKQKIGRGLRLKKFKSKLIVVDWAHWNFRLGLKHAKKRLSTYVTEGMRVVEVDDLTNWKPVF